MAGSTETPLAGSFLRSVGPASHDLRCDVYDSIGDAPVDWRELRAPLGVYQSRGWLGFCESTAAGDARLVVARAGSGQALGMLPVFVVPVDEAGLYAPAVTLGGEHAELLGHRVCAAGGFGGYRGGFLLAPPASGREAAVVATLLEAADEVATELGAGVFSLQYLPAVQAELAVASGLVVRDELVFQESEVLVPVPEGGFDEYVAGLSQKRRATVRRDLAAFEAAGCSLTESRLSEALDFAPRLFVQLKESHLQPLSEDEASEWLRAQARVLDDVSVVFAARDSGGATVAYALAYVWGDAIHLRAVGLDHARARLGAAYFAATYYAPLRYAARHGLSWVHLGIKALRPKVLRGGVLQDLHGVFRGRGGWRVPPSLVEEASARRRGEIASELGPLLPV